MMMQDIMTLLEGELQSSALGFKSTKKHGCGSGTRLHAHWFIFKILWRSHPIRNWRVGERPTACDLLELGVLKPTRVATHINV